MREKYKKRQDEVMRVRRENLEKQREKQAANHRKKAAEISSLCLQLEKLGGSGTVTQTLMVGWRSSLQKKCSWKPSKCSLATGERFCSKKLLNAKTWNFSEGGRPFTASIMIQKLKEIVRLPLKAY
jgi:hypothetical protein